MRGPDDMLATRLAVCQSMGGAAGCGFSSCLRGDDESWRESLLRLASRSVAMPRCTHVATSLASFFFGRRQHVVSAIRWPTHYTLISLVSGNSVSRSLLVAAVIRFALYCISAI